MPSLVSAHGVATAEEVEQHYARRLRFETDCADVHAALSDGSADFVLLEARGPAAYARAHVPGALNLPHREIIEARLAAWPGDTLFVVYCAGPHCNGADQAAVKLARLGRRVKVMPGGMAGWREEGFACATGAEPGSLVAEASGA